MVVFNSPFIQAAVSLDFFVCWHIFCSDCLMLMKDLMKLGYACVLSRNVIATLFLEISYCKAIWYILMPINRIEYLIEHCVN